MRSLIAILAFALLVAACGSAEDATSTSTGATDTTTTIPDNPTGTTMPFQTGELVRLDVPRATPQPTDDQYAAVVRGDIELGLDLLRSVAGEDNTMLSPYSIATALSMLYPGARGETAEEVAAVLNLEVSDETLHAVRNAIDLALLAEPPPQSSDDERVPFAIRPANSSWGQGGYPFIEEYLQILAEQYGAGLRLLDFAGDPEGSREIINAWVEDVTEDRIKDLIPAGVISGLTRMVLVNAIWFKANWAEQFDSALTTDDPFTLASGESVTVPTMHGNVPAGYAVNDKFEAVRLRYAGDAAMVVAVPRSGSLTELVAGLTADDLDIDWDSYDVEVSLPLFEFEAEIALKDALIELGMVKAFNEPFGPDGADLTGITELRELFVSDALHKTFIAVDESGTEAAAATALIMSLTSAPQPATFTADQPFLFWIEHSSTGEMLFLGQVTDPR
ncbi:MAG: serpin family protein [Acidimicrobiia bacterium]|nr:serpin family protein [Acidimicrobiia bacterium]